MLIQKLVENWIKYFNRNYPNYLNSFKEPRYQAKSFLFYSYKLFLRLNEISYWDNYIQSLENIFLRDPSNDYYGHRNPKNSTRSQPISLEWVTTFEIIKVLDFPGNQSAEQKLVKYVNHYFEEIKNDLEVEKFQDLMISSSLDVPKIDDMSEWFLEWLKANYNSEIASPHNIVSYLDFLYKIDSENILITKMIEDLVNWVEKNNESPERRILVLARIILNLDWVHELTTKKIFNKIKEDFFENLEKIKQITWHNSPLILEAAYYLHKEQERKTIQHILLENLTNAKIYKIMDLFPFLKSYVKLDQLEEEVLSIKEKCTQHPTADMCMNCINEPQGICWTRILAKILGTTPSTHFSFEIGDVVKYTHQKGIYFVIKADKITKMRREGDILYRQCTSLFISDFSLVFYFNPHYTAPMVIEPIKKISTNMKTKPIFFVLERNHIFQIYNHYKEMESE